MKDIKNIKKLVFGMMKNKINSKINTNSKEYKNNVEKFMELIKNYIIESSGMRAAKVHPITMVSPGASIKQKIILIHL